MMDWRITKDSQQARDERWRALPKPAVTKLYGPDRYIASDNLIEAINTAILLGQPLLLTGEPGCGKTEVGNFVAWKLGLKEALRFDVKSTTTARDLFYIPDTIARFHAAHEAKGNIDPLRFIKFQALGKAILYANDAAAVASFLPENEHPGRRRSVVLIDEIDKAPPDVPNDLLMEIENMQFYIPEISRTVVADKDMRPVVIITSNSERVLPGPFLRRCIYYDLPFPNRDELRQIAEARITDLPRDFDLVGDALTVLVHVRKLDLQKKPGTAELLSFLLALQALGYKSKDQLRSDERWQIVAKQTLLKSGEDQALAFKRFDWSGVS
jgi:MoxR-like ATPase